MVQAKEAKQSPYALNLDAWTGQQRTFDAPQIVFRITAQGLLEDLRERSALRADRLRDHQARAKTVYNPSTQSTIGWLRVYVDDAQRLIIIDEAQSDLIKTLYSEQVYPLDGASSAVIREFVAGDQRLASAWFCHRSALGTPYRLSGRHPQQRLGL